MTTFIKSCLSHSRAVVLILLVLIIGGLYSYITMPKESSPNIPIPYITVSMYHQGISPEDAERLLVRPMEKELRNIEGIKEMTATARENTATVTLEFEAGFDSNKALLDVREKVDIAKTELPEETDEPIVNEANFSLFPILVVGLYGNLSEDVLLRTAKDLKDKLKELPQVLDVDIAGDRIEQIEIVIEPSVLENYNLQFNDILPLVSRNNQLIAAGTIDTGVGRTPIKVPGVFETLSDILNTPLKVTGDSVIKFKDVSYGTLGYVDRTDLARINGKPGLALEVKKRTGENVIETVQAIKYVVDEVKEYWPEGIEVTYFQDQSNRIVSMLLDLQNNLISAFLLVMIIVVAFLGVRSALLIGIAVPGSFLTGLLILNLMGININTVVLFSLILAVGMLVDGAIVVIEFADRKMLEGLDKKDAYLQAAQKMFPPIFISTLTTLVAFMPLLFWPGIVGEFMKFLPTTLITVLSASLLMAIIFIPTLGKSFGKKPYIDPNNKTYELLSGEKGSNIEELKKLPGITGKYVRLLSRVIKRPILVITGATLFLISVYIITGLFGKGIEFFPSIEPEQAVANLYARGNLSVTDIDKIMQKVESRIATMPEIKTLYSRSSLNLSHGDSRDDLKGSIYLEFIDWKYRKKANEIFKEMYEHFSDIGGVEIELIEMKAGPPVGKPINVQLTSTNTTLLDEGAQIIREKLESMEGVKDVEDSRSVPGIEWEVTVDKGEASRYGADILLTGSIITMITSGLKIGTYRPDYTDDEIDIRLRYPQKYRTISQINNLKIPTPSGIVPIKNFMSYNAKPKVEKIRKTDGKVSVNIKAEVEKGYLADTKLKELQKWMKETRPIDPAVKLTYKGEDKEQNESKAFLFKAFIIALAIMAIILLIEFNSFYLSFLILTAVVFSTVGVFLGLFITQQPFGIVMGGIGVIALAGIVVNNNIVLIDTYKGFIEKGLNNTDAIIKTCAQRVRPVMLTTITTILGLIPMVCKLNIDFLNREVDYGAPSTQWWAQLSTCIAFGLAFSTFLTLFLTPCLLELRSRFSILKASKPEHID